MVNVQNEWISTPEAARILSKNSGHTIRRDYVIRLVTLGKLECWRINAHALLIKRSSAEAYKVKKQPQRA